MKRLHLHLSVDDPNANIHFYSALFRSEPHVVHRDYAKWMLEDPKVTFAISARGAPPGLDHLGIQVESDAELTEMEVRLNEASLPVLEQKGTACCYSGPISTGPRILRESLGRRFTRWGRSRSLVKSHQLYL